MSLRHGITSATAGYNEKKTVVDDGLAALESGVGDGPSCRVADNGNIVGAYSLFRPLTRTGAGTRSRRWPPTRAREPPSGHDLLWRPLSAPSIWYGTGFAIAYSGPVGALICFFIIGVVDVFFVVQCLGEMSVDTISHPNWCQLRRCWALWSGARWSSTLLVGSCRFCIGPRRVHVCYFA